MREKVVQFFERESSVWGPLFLLSTLAIGAKAPVPFGLLLLALAGFFLCARLQMSGFYYTLVLLSFAAAIQHTFFTSDHLWQLGVEASLGLAFFIVALASEQGVSLIDSLHQQLQIRKTTIENLEDEIAKVQESHLSQQITLSEKVAALQKELEELQADHSSILILNEVLRKTTARHAQESESLAAAKRGQEGQAAYLKEELKEMEKELERLANTEALAIQNRELMEELNAARSAKEQTHLINETLARLYARESLKAKEADSEAADLESQLIATRKEAEKMAISLREQLAASSNEIDTLSSQLERAVSEIHQDRLVLQKFNETQAERNALREKLQAASEEIAHLQKQQPKADPRLTEQLAYAQQKMVHLSQMEPMLKQLKKQFEEKNQVLQETRTHLFRTDTELQKLRLEKVALELSPFPREVEHELRDLGEQVQALEEENQQLQELITLLADPSSDAAKRKKKVKTPTPPDQEFLF